MRKVTFQLNVPKKGRNVLPVLKESAEVVVVKAAVPVVDAVMTVSPVNLDQLPASTAAKKVTDPATAQMKRRRVLAVPVVETVVVEVIVAIHSEAKPVRKLTLWIEPTELVVDTVATAKVALAAEAGVEKDLPV